jgi:SAM-dependent methyltransferase
MGTPYMSARNAPKGRQSRATATRPPPLPDRHVLYEASVQNAGVELELAERLLARHRQPARRLREDFSGTALLSSTWVMRGPARTAVAVDLDPAPHRWARRHRLPLLGTAAGRLTLTETDVRQGPAGDFDLILALNFSWQVLQTRQDVLAWLANARAALAPGGLLLLDLFGGWLSQQHRVERRRVGKGVTYLWEHVAFNPIDSRIRCAIHFELRDGRRLRNAFTYDWRLWTPREVTELLGEAGFGDVEVLWDVAPPGVEPRYLPRRSAENIPGWLAHVVARRPKGGGRP